MKRICAASTTAFLVLLSAATTLGAQEKADRPTLGLYGGLSLATIDSKDLTTADYQAGFLAGLSARWHFGSHWGFQPAVEYVQKGLGFTVTETGGTTTGNVYLNYVELPLLLRMQADKMQGVTPYLLAGPSVAFKAGCSAKAKSGAVTITAKCSDLTDIESLDYGAMFGAGADFSIGGLTWTLAARYDLGLKTIAKDGSEAKNRAFSFVLGFNW